MARQAITKADIISDIKRTRTISATFDSRTLLQYTGITVRDQEVMNRVRRAINTASLRIVTDLKAALDDAIQSNTWQGINGINDIYDSGELLRSGRVQATSNGFTIAYDAPYAAMIHYGGYITPYGRKTGERIYLPARPWVDAVLRGGGPVPQFNITKYYEQELIKALNGR